MATRTRTFGAGNRESHDASDFYARFTAPELSDDETVNACGAADSIFCGDARDMHQVDDNSVALVVTSPPYFAGKAYETDLEAGHIPSTYLEYLTMLRDVFAECRRVLEPGGRMCVNVANLGRKPYRSLAGDVTTILQDELAMLLRGEIVWVKAKGAAGSCAFGSYMKASNPVLRDLTERVVIASKGRFARAPDLKTRRKVGLPHESDITKEEFLASTLDVWEIRPERARRVNHPAPFPVELPERFIRLYTYLGDVVLDPFLGSGSSAVAAVRTGRHYVGYDLDPEYVANAEARVAEAREAGTADAGD
jgi:site-specific DNA-methyltransferase (adenine-specific)